MPDSASNELIYKIPKQIQTDIVDLKKAGPCRTSSSAHPAHARGHAKDGLRHQTTWRPFRADVDLIKRRLNLVEA